VRGIGNNPASDGLEGSAGIYLDNVYLGRPGMAVFDLLDVEQLELLRGPQGTLFGKNTTAGVLNITTRKPTFTPESSVEASGGEDGYFQGKGTFSGPLTDTLAGRLSPTAPRRRLPEQPADNGTLSAASARASWAVAVQARRRLQPALDQRVQQRELQPRQRRDLRRPARSGSAPAWSAPIRCSATPTSTAGRTSACIRAAARWRPTGTSPATSP
jgi:outer membrane receptor protein involved in Fe transport